jgi:choline dehydrogenase-like flavoprotein
VRIKSPDPAAYPEIRLNYLSTEEDRKVAVDGMRFTRRIMAANAMAKYRPQEYRPGASITNDDELARAAGGGMALVVAQVIAEVTHALQQEYAVGASIGPASDVAG